MNRTQRRARSPELAVELWGSCRHARVQPARLPRGTRSARRGCSRGPHRRIDGPQRDRTLDDLYAKLRTVAVDEPLAGHAGDLAARHALRGYIAVHLGRALQLHGDDILLARWDNALNAAARATGRLLANDAA